MRSMINTFSIYRGQEKQEVKNIIVLEETLSDMSIPSSLLDLRLVSQNAKVIITGCMSCLSSRGQGAGDTADEVDLILILSITPLF